jgi:hypothetical protein
MSGIHDVNRNEQLQMCAIGPLYRSGKDKDFCRETFSAEELLICYVIFIRAVFEHFLLESIYLVAV